MGYRKTSVLKIAGLFLVAFLMIFSNSQRVSAYNLGDKWETIFKNNRFLFWNPYEKRKSKKQCQNGYIGEPGEGIVKDMGNNAQTVFNYLTQNGYSNVAAAAIMGNLRAEGGAAFNPRQLEKISANSVFPGYIAPENFIAYENGKKTYSGGFGIAQWTYYTRVRDLQNFANSLGKPVTSLSVQVQFLVQELSGYGITPSLLNSMNLRDAAAYVLRNYEKPKNQSESVVDTRTGYATEFIDYIPSDEVIDENGEICVEEDEYDDDNNDDNNEIIPRQYSEEEVKEIMDKLDNGGLSLKEAIDYMNIYKSISPSEYAYYNIDPGVDSGNGPLYNCVAFVKYYLKQKLGKDFPKTGNGVDVVKNIIKPGVTPHTEPKVGAIFSTARGASSGSGHTGVILGIWGDSIIIGEAGYHEDTTYTTAKTKKLKDYIGNGYIYAYPEDIR